MNKSILLALALLPLVAGAQQAATAQSASLPTVTIAANGVDVKTVLGNMFTQVKRNYVIQPNTHFNLNLALSNIDFDEALQIVCSTADLKYEIQNGIYFISRAPAKAKPTPAAAPIQTAPAPQPKRFLPESTLSKRLTTRLSRTAIADVFEAFGKQTGVPFELDKSIPAYKLDAFLINTSLKYALEKVTAATGTKYELTDHGTIRIYRPTVAAVEESRVAISR